MDEIMAIIQANPIEAMKVVMISMGLLLLFRIVLEW